MKNEKMPSLPANLFRRNAFCLEDGSLLSASFNLHEEQETVFRPVKIKDTPAKFFLPDEHNEIPTVFSNKNVNLNFPRQPKSKINSNMIILSCLIGFFLLAAAYTGTIIPLFVGFVVVLIYVLVWLIIKRVMK